MKFQYYYSLSLVFLLLFPYASSHFFSNTSSIPISSNKSRTPWSTFHTFTNCEFGKQYPGLSKLKTYFHNFGYIPQNISATNFTDEFDRTVRTAVKKYQQNFNLNVTGELDTQTLEYMVRPRCGNPDIINGTNTMFTSKPSSTTNSSTLTNTVSRYTFFSGTPRWEYYDLTYAFLPSNQLSSTIKSVFSRAFLRWSTVTPLTFKEIDSYSTADITIGFYGGEHGDGEAFDGKLGVLAHSFSPPFGMFHLDIDEAWVIDGDVRNAEVYEAVDLESVAVHEIGHLLGLGHSADVDAIMYPLIMSRMRKVELGEDDVEGIQVLYGSNPDYNGTYKNNDVSGGYGGGWRWGSWEMCFLLLGLFWIC